jgi:hypothetical protein
MGKSTPVSGQRSTFNVQRSTAQNHGDERQNSEVPAERIGKTAELWMNQSLYRNRMPSKD